MTLHVELENKNIKYNVNIGKLSKLTFNRKVAIVTNTTISKLHLKKLLTIISAKELNVITLPDGEEYKNLNTINDILNECFDNELDRNSLLIAFGGGVIGDMTGLSASLYQRGIDFIQIPTTLLAQVDASVGGKTGVNNKYGKNLIGSFYQPKEVFIDPSFLKTLPKREFSAGIAEIIKMAITLDKNLYKELKGITLDNIQNIIQKSIELKISLINQDEKEEGIRAVLNYGHTFAHVIEKETEYKQFLHGEAVSIGIVMANEVAYELGLISMNEINDIKDLLMDYNLPITYKIKNIDNFYNDFFLDKKSKDNVISFILPNEIGNYKILSNIDEKIIKKVLIKFT